MVFERFVGDELTGYRRSLVGSGQTKGEVTVVNKAKAKRSVAGAARRGPATQPRKATPIRAKKPTSSSKVKAGAARKAPAIKATKTVRKPTAAARAAVAKLRATKLEMDRMQDRRLLHSIRVRNLLSFGSETSELKLRSLNVLVGLNSSGKSNLIEVIRLLQALPTDITKPIQEGGGIEHWLHKAQEHGASDHRQKERTIGEVQAVLGHTFPYPGTSSYRTRPYRYQLGITERPGREIRLQYEQLDLMRGNSTTSNLRPIFRYSGDNEFEIMSRSAGGNNRGFLEVERDDSQRDQSYFHRMQTSRDAPLLRWFSKRLEAMRIYSDWTLGRGSALRSRQSADEIESQFREDLSNIASVVSNVVQDPGTKDQILHEMARHTNCIKDFGLSVRLGYADVFFREGQKLIPARRMSDGALRLFFLLAVLCDPNPPPLICIEEPEIGMHADVIPALVDLMTEAAQRTQLIVTTHSEVLIDSLTDNPEALVICEQVNGRTEMSRLDMGEVLKRSGRKNADHGLAWFWQRGFLGGTK